MSATSGNYSVICKDSSQQPPPEQQPIAIDEVWGTAATSLHGKSYWQINNASSKQGLPKEMWHPNGYAVKFYLDLGEIYIERDETTRFVKYAASRQDPGALQPPELALNEVCPSRPPRHFNTASNFLYSDPDDSTNQEDEYYEVNTRGHLLQEEKLAKGGGSGVQALSVTAGSPTFTRFIKHVERVNRERLGDHFICLSCWCFIDLDQQQVHQRCQHVCASVGSIRDEETFLRQAATFNRFNIGSQTVQIFRKYSKTMIEKIDVIKCHTRSDFVKHYRMTIRKEIAHMKGAPPLLGKPLVPADMIPFNDPKIFKASEELRFKFMAHEIRSMPTMRGNRQANRDILFNQVLGDVMDCFGDSIEEITFEVAEMRHSLEEFVSWLHPVEIAKIRRQREIRKAEMDQARAELAEDLEMLLLNDDGDVRKEQQNFSSNPLTYREDLNGETSKGNLRKFGSCTQNRKIVKQQRKQVAEERARIKAQKKALRADTLRLQQIKRDRRRQAKLGSLNAVSKESVGTTGEKILMDEHAGEEHCSTSNPFLINRESQSSEISFDPEMIPDRGKPQALTDRNTPPPYNLQQFPFSTAGVKTPQKNNFARPLKPLFKVSRENLQLKRAKTPTKFGCGEKLDLGGLFSDSSIPSNSLSLQLSQPPVQEISVSQNLKRVAKPQQVKAPIQKQTNQLPHSMAKAQSQRIVGTGGRNDGMFMAMTAPKKKRNQLDKKVEKAQKTIEMLQAGTFFGDFT